MSSDENAPEDDYEVGYGKPPKDTQFKPGRSGNPRGRPKGARNFTTELREELNERIPIREGGKVRRISKRRAVLKAQVAKALNGDPRSAQLVMNLMATYLAEEEHSDDDASLTPDDAVILADFLRSHREYDDD